MSIFVFFHVGSDIQQPSMLAHSIRISNPEAIIIQCTDLNTASVPGVNEVHRTKCDSSKLMISRLEGFAKLNLKEPAIYLDTDMLVIKRINPNEIIKNRKKYTLNSDEGRHKFDSFKNNLKFIEEYNSRKKHKFTLGIGPFADLTNEEFIEKMLMKPGLIMDSTRDKNSTKFNNFRNSIMK